MLQERKHTFYSWYVVALLVVGVLFDGTPEVLAQTQNAHKESMPTTESGPVGYWQSVDFVKNVDDFIPGQKKWGGDLFLKDLSCSENGETSIPVYWENESFFDTKNGSPVSAQYFTQTMNDSTYLFFPWFPSLRPEDNTIWYYVLKKISDQPTKEQLVKKQTLMFQNISAISSVEEYDDVRWKDLTNINLTGHIGLVGKLWFNKKTVWPDSTRMPPDSDPKKLLIDAMNPGLGIRDLHRQGITGKGVNVAIIDYPLFTDHPEFADNIAAYHEVGCESKSSMHGPAVLSLLVGLNCGTAPEARVYYVATRDGSTDTQYHAQALEWIIAQNDKLSSSEKIRVVSVSAAPSGPGSHFTTNQEMWDEACSHAEAKGILVLDCTRHHGFISPCYFDTSDPENVARCKPGFPNRKSNTNIPGHIRVPSSPRTTAEEYNKGECLYQYCGVGGLSWSIPYCAGVLALGWQLRPDLTSEQMKDILFHSGYVDESGAKFINPKEFIRMVKTMPRV